MQKYEKRLKDGKYFNLFYLSSFIFTTKVSQVKIHKRDLT